MRQVIIAILLLCYTIFLYADVTSDATNDLIDEVRNFINNENPDGALDLLNEAIKTDKKDSTAYALRGYVYHIKGDDRKGLADCNKALNIAPELYLGYWKRALIYKDTAQLDKALKDLDKAIELSSADAKLYQNRGEAYIQKKMYTEAENDLRRAIELDSTNLTFIYILGDMFESNGEYDKALDLYNTALYQFADDPVLYQARGRIYYNLRKYDEAVLDLLDSLGKDPFRPGPYVLLGAVYEQQEQYGKALDTYMFAVEENIKDTTIFLALGNLSRDVFLKYDEALDYYKKGLELDNEDTTLYLNRGKAYYYIKDYQNATVDFTLADANGKEAEPFEWRGYCFQDTGVYNEAIKDYNLCIKLEPENPFYYHKRGELYLAKNVTFRAIKEFESAIKLDSQHSESYAWLGYLYKVAGKYTKALAYLEKIGDINPGDSYAKTELGVMYYLTGQHEKAYEILNTLRDGSDASYLHYLSLISGAVLSEELYRENLSKLVKARTGFDDWAGSLADAMSGDVSADVLIEKAQKDNGKLCEAYTYLGYALVYKGEFNAAKAYFRKASGTRMKEHLEYHLARYELKVARNWKSYK